MGKRLTNLFLKMIQIDSESGNEKEFLNFLKNYFEKNIFANCIFDNYGNLIIKIKSKNSVKTEPILFSVHADTVKPGKNIKPILKDGIIRSDGRTILGADDKAGISELIEAIHLAEKYPPLEIVVSRKEELIQVGIKNIDRSLLESKIGFVVDMEDPSEIVIGAPSYMSMDITVLGQASHAGEPEKGISSIYSAAVAIAKLGIGRVDKDTTINIGIIKGGLARNIVPEKTKILFELRSFSHQKCIFYSNKIEKVFNSTLGYFGASFKINKKILARSFNLPKEAKAVQIAQQAISNVHLKPVLSTRYGVSDASCLNEYGIETVALGMGGINCHTANENISIEDMGKTVQIIKEIMRLLS